MLFFLYPIVIVIFVLLFFFFKKKERHQIHINTSSPLWRLCKVFLIYKSKFWIHADLSIIQCAYFSPCVILVVFEQSHNSLCIQLKTAITRANSRNDMLTIRDALEVSAEMYKKDPNNVQDYVQRHLLSLPVWEELRYVVWDNLIIFVLKFILISWFAINLSCHSLYLWMWPH